MSWRNIHAVLLQEIYVTLGSWEVIFDIFVFTLVNIMLFGFIANYLAQGNDGVQAQSLLISIIFWEVIRINQYSTSVSSMWNVWSHNLSNMFIAPIRITEYIVAHIISATFKSLLLFLSAIVLSRYIFHLNLLSLGIFPIAFSYINMVIFATAIGLVLIGLVFQFGTRIQALTWGTIYILEPICAVFFPVSILPAWLQPVSYSLPVTYFFEWLRAIHNHTAYGISRVWLAFGLNLVFLLACCFIFSRQLAASKRSGQLARNDL